MIGKIEGNPGNGHEKNGKDREKRLLSLIEEVEILKKFSKKLQGDSQNDSSSSTTFSSPPPNYSNSTSSTSMTCDPRTPPNSQRIQISLSPPSPPGRRFPGGHSHRSNARNSAYAGKIVTKNRITANGRNGYSSRRNVFNGATSLIPPPTHHPQSINWRYVAYIITVSLETWHLKDENR